MFFNYDVLFRSGPLALVWLVGTGNFKGKSGRNKHYLAVLESNVAEQCKTMRNLLPKMGTCDGIPLKKMGILARGVSLILLIKMERLTNEIRTTLQVLKKPVTFQHPLQLAEEKQRKRKGRNGNDLPENLPDNGPGIILQFDQMDRCVEGDFFFDENPSVMNFGGDFGDDESFNERRSEERGDFSDPRLIQTPKRRRIEMESTLRDPRANLLPEVDADLAVERPDLDPDLDLGDGFVLLQDMMPPPQDPEIIPDETTHFMAPPSDLAQDKGPVEETPAVIGTRAGNLKRKRNEVREEEMDMTILPPVEVDQDTPRRRRLVGRRRLRLQIDEDTCISLQDILDRVQEMRAEGNMENLEELLRENMAPGKSNWQKVAAARMSTIEYITLAGRSCPATELKRLIGDGMKKQAELPPKQVVLEAGRAVDETASRMDQATDVGGERTDLGGDRLDPIDEMNHDIPIQNEPEEIQETMHPTCEPEQGDIEVSSLAAELDFVQPVGPPAAPPNEDSFPVTKGKKPSKRSKQDTSEMLLKKVGGEEEFGNIFPEGKCSKAKAARGFLSFMKLQAEKRVEVTQKEPFGEMRIRKL